MRIIKTVFIFFAALAVLSAAEPESKYQAIVEGTPGLVAHWRFEETIDPRLEPAKKGTHIAVDEEAMKGIFFPGGASLKVSARLHDSKDDYIGRTEEVTAGEKGISGKAFRFNGKDSLVYIFRDPGLEPGVDDFSFELWIKPDSTDNAAMLLNRISPFAKGSGGIFFQMSPKGAVVFSIVESQKRSMSMTAPEGTIGPGRWHHIVALRRSSALALYVNGKLIKEESGEPGLRIPTYGDYIIGGTPWNRRFLGLIDEVAYYNVALPPEEIAKHFRAPVSAP